MGQRAGDLLGVGPAPGHALPHHTVPHRQLPGPPADGRQHRRRHRGGWEDFYEDFTAHPPKYFVDTSPAKVRGAQYYPISEFPRLERLVKSQYRYVVTIDDIDVYKRK